MSRNHLNRGAVTARRLAVLGCQLLRAGCPDVRQFLLGFLRKVPWVIILQSSSRGGASCRIIADRAGPHWRIRCSLWSSTSHPSAGYTALFALRIARSTQNQLVNDKDTHPLLAQLTAHKFCVPQPDNRQGGVATSHDNRRRKALHSGTPAMARSEPLDLAPRRGDRESVIPERRQNSWAPHSTSWRDWAQES
jgi:hypothetical protein